MLHDPAIRPKRSRDAIKAAWEVFQEAIGEKPPKEARDPEPPKPEGVATNRPRHASTREKQRA
jgi:hypothetical protein